MGFFDPKYKLKVHILQIILIHVVMGVSVPQMFIKGQPRSRANTIALGMGGKSMIIISYQILTEHRPRFSRWKSYKAYAILNGLEIVFWAAVVFLIIQANTKSCVGISCTLRWIAVVVSIGITIVSVYMFIISYMDFRVHRMQGEYKDSRRIMSSADVEYGQPMDHLHVKRHRASEPESPHLHRHGRHGRQHSGGRHSASRSSSHGMEQRSNRSSMSRGDPSEHRPRRHSMSRNHSQGREQHSRRDSRSRRYSSEHQARRHSISRGSGTEYDTRAHAQGPHPPRYYAEVPWSPIRRE